MEEPSGLVTDDRQHLRVGDGAFAIIWHPNVGYEFVTPNMKDPKNTMPWEGLLLTACMVLANRDEDWCRDTVAAVFPEAPEQYRK